MLESLGQSPASGELHLQWGSRGKLSISVAATIIPMIVTLDTREPDSPHPWERFLPEGWSFERGSMETGDVCLASLPDGVVIERKSPGDLAGCIGASRERFERELKRSRYCGRFLVICEGTLADVVTAARGVHYNAVIGTISVWSIRYAPILFCGSVQVAAQIAFSALKSQIRDIERGSKALQRNSTQQDAICATDY